MSTHDYTQNECYNRFIRLLLYPISVCAALFVLSNFFCFVNLVLSDDFEGSIAIAQLLLVRVEQGREFRNKQGVGFVQFLVGRFKATATSRIATAIARLFGL